MGYHLLAQKNCKAARVQLLWLQALRMCKELGCVPQSVGRLILLCLSLASSWALLVALLTLLGAGMLLVLVGEVGVGAGAAFLRLEHLSHCWIMCRRCLAKVVLEWYILILSPVAPAWCIQPAPGEGTSEATGTGQPISKKLRGQKCFPLLPGLLPVPPEARWEDWGNFSSLSLLETVCLAGTLKLPSLLAGCTRVLTQTQIVNMFSLFLLNQASQGKLISG